jgi:hypothetical protein
MLAEAAWLERLARCLVRHDGEDLVQDTWLAAIESPPALDEPFRSALVLRFQEGRSAVQIARASGVPEGTVRWRVKEGLDRLRRALDDRYNGRTSRWRALLLSPGKGAMVATKIKGVGVGVLLALGAAIGGVVLFGWPTGRTPVPDDARRTAGDRLAKAGARDAVTMAAPASPGRSPSVAHVTGARKTLPRFGQGGPRRIFEPKGYEKARREATAAVEIFNAEIRDWDWAPRMEEKIRERFDAQRMADHGLHGFSVANLECRESTCRLDLEWPQELETRLRTAGLIKEGEHATVHHRRRQGVLAQRTAWLGKHHVHANGRWRIEHILLFSEKEIDPDAYATWVREMEAQYAAGVYPRAPVTRDTPLPPRRPGEVP